MKVKKINTVLFIALILTSCTPAVTVVSPTATAVPLPTVTSIPPTATFMPTSASETALPIGEPIVPLSNDGPWLLYVHNSPRPGGPDSNAIPPEFILMNQNGSGRTSITFPESPDPVDAFLMQQNSVNYMTQYDGGLYLFRPAQSTGVRIHRCLRDIRCKAFFTGDEKGGLLASTYLAEGRDVPELIIYELPDGKIRDRFPLVRCGDNAKVCNQHRSRWNEMGGQELQWSPNGRYLAFAAILDSDSSDLYVYDAQNRNLRRLTHGPDWVGPIDWSPDGSQIIMQEILNYEDFFLTPNSFPPSSVWSVSVSTNEIKLLYFTNGQYAQNIMFWLDANHFVAYEGFLVNANQAFNLRFVDLEAGINRILFDGTFGTISFDPIHQTFVLYALYPEPYPQGLYLVSMKSGTIHPLDGPQSFPDWDENTGFFLSIDTCENDRQSFQAFDYQGNFKCVRVPTPTPEPLEISNYLSPNGKWTLSAKDGLWLETEGQATVQVTQEIVSEIIWCPDSSCFFFSVSQSNQQPKQQWTLYRASLPDLTIKTVDEGIESSGSYQWLGGSK